jgi:hypothetical protein
LNSSCEIHNEKLYAIYNTILPKVKPALIADLLTREIRVKIDTEEAKMYIIQKTGMVPSIHDHGTHYVTNQKLTLEILKEISDSGDVLEVTGEYSVSCGSIGSVHERSEKYE